MKKTKKVALLSFASLLALSLVACGDLNGTGGTGSGNGGSSDSDVVAVLPGTSGGTSNESDKFAGKTFYDKSSEAESYTKYVFGNDGTFTVSSRSYTYDSTGTPTYGNFEEPTYEYKYSLSSDGKTFYRAGNRATIYLITNTTKTNLMTYSEFVNYLKSNEFKSATKEALGWDNITNEDKKDMLSQVGVDENAGFDEFYQAYLKMLEEMCKPYYSQVSSYSISTETDTSTNSYILLTGTVDSDSKDLSKMNFTGSFDKSSSGSGSRIDYFSIYSVISNSSVSIFSSDSTDYRYYSISKIDATKITFEKQASSRSEEKETFDATYTVEGSGTDTKIKVTFPADKGGETIELSFKPETMSLYEEK